MTEMLEVNIEEALARIDQGLSTLTARELMSASEVSDMLLDLRLLLMTSAPVEAEVSEPAVSAADLSV